MDSKFKLALALFFLINLLAFYQVLAAPLTLTIFPIKQIVSLQPSTVYNANFTVVNSNNFPLEVDIDKEDFVPSPGTANIDFMPKAPGTTSLVDWLSVPAQVVLKPGETKLVPYTIEVPANPEPGSHFAAVFFKATPTSGQTLATSLRIGSIFLASLPGAVKKTGELVSLNAPNFASKGPISFNVVFENTGTVHYTPSGDIKIYNLFNSQVADIPLSQQIVLPTGIKTLTATWDAGYGFGPYKSMLDIQDGDNNHYFGQAQTWLLPWPEILIGLGIIIIIWLVLKYFGSHFHISVSRK